MVIRTQAREETHQITQLETGIVSRDVHLGENRDEWQELYRLQVPTGLTYVFRPEDHFSIYQEYLEDALDAAFADDGGTFTDETAAANEATANDMTLMPATEVINDAYYFGYRYPWGRLRLTIGTAGVGTAITWEYYNGSTWATILGLVDGTSGFTATAGTNNVNFNPPGNWARTVVNGHENYWIRARVSTASFTTVPIGTRGFINGGSMEILNTDRIRVHILDSARLNRVPILGENRYVQVKEFQDVTKKARLSLRAPVAAKQGAWIVIEILPQAGIVDVSNGYFALECRRIREGIV